MGIFLCAALKVKKEKKNKQATKLIAAGEGNRSASCSHGKKLKVQVSLARNKNIFEIEIRPFNDECCGCLSNEQKIIKPEFYFVGGNK